MLLGLLIFLLIVGSLAALKGISKVYNENKDVREKWRKRRWQSSLFGGIHYMNSDKNRQSQTHVTKPKVKNTSKKKKGKHCTKCGTEIAEDALFCHTCGKSLNTEVRFCQYCGKHRIDDAVFCHKCGNLIISLTDMNFKVGNGDVAKDSDTVKYCNSCGNTRDKKEPYCSNCGALFRHEI